MRFFGKREWTHRAPPLGDLLNGASINSLTAYIVVPLGMNNFTILKSIGQFSKTLTNNNTRILGGKFVQSRTSNYKCMFDIFFFICKCIVIVV